MRETMEQAIKAAMKRHSEFPELGSQESIIKMEVASWLWEKYKALIEEKEMKELESLEMIEFMSKITK